VTDDRLWAVVRQLPDQQRRAVVLRYVEDLPIAEVALVLGCSASSIKTHLGRARSAMARQLGDPREEVTR
jgi:RNA polymerase sigma factor (sigma-70 family)